MPSLTARSTVVRVLSLTCTVGLSMVALTGCSALQSLFPAQADRNTNSNQVTQAGVADVFTLAVGDCFNEPSTDTNRISSVGAVPCSQPHDLEVYGSFHVAGTTYPGKEAILDQAVAGCGTAFTAFVGIAPTDSELSFGELYPTEGSWNRTVPDRTIHCIIAGSSPTLGTLKGAKK